MEAGGGAWSLPERKDGSTRPQADVAFPRRRRRQTAAEGGKSMAMHRCALLKAGAAAPLGGLPWRSAKAQAANTIRLALLCDFSGT